VVSSEDQQHLDPDVGRLQMDVFVVKDQYTWRFSFSAWQKKGDISSSKNGETQMKTVIKPL
jgi:hypothetical protein